MPTSSTTPAQPSLVREFVKFANTTGGLDFALRLIQALAMVATELYTGDISAKCFTASSQLGFARRFMRLHCFIECFQRAYDMVSGDVSLFGSIQVILDLGKWTFLGLYLFMENFTILHDMGIYVVSWNTPLLMEANKIWFYGMIISIAGTLLEALYGPPAKKAAPEPPRQGIDEKNEKKEKPSEKPAPSSEQGSSQISLLERLVVDLCDINLPGSFVGWIPIGDLGIGLTMVVSSFIVLRDIWLKTRN